MQNRNSTEDVLESRVDKFSYIPKAHVQFLEQSGIIVVPISFLDSEEEIVSMLGEVNGIYIPGDSQKAITNKKYQKSFSTITKYVIDQNKKNGDYFPMFMMGKSCQTFITQVGASKHTL
jgi:gamma-glutamyl-gamma-aminobutyrate hydrolase PuuD